MAMRQSKLTDLWNVPKLNQPSPAPKVASLTIGTGEYPAVAASPAGITESDESKSSTPPSPTLVNSNSHADSTFKRKVSVIELSSDDESKVVPDPSIVDDTVAGDKNACCIQVIDSLHLKTELPANRSVSVTTIHSSINNTHNDNKMRARLTCHFRGSMLGALLGDCYGARSEGRSHIAKLRLIDSYVEKGISRYHRLNVVLPYTDDTAMCHETASSLLACGGFNPCDMARRYAENYFAEPDRGYGGNIGNTFKSWRAARYQNVHESAKQQFDGKGSYGNGAAMRIAPVPLLYHGRKRDMVDIALKSSQLTHANIDGYNGGLLQALAVECALQRGLEENGRANFSPVNFVRTLEREFIKHAKTDELTQNSSSNEEIGPGLVGQQLRRLVELVEHEAGRPLSPSVIVNELGNGVAAHKSVPTAIYAFLWGTYDADIVCGEVRDGDILPDNYTALQRTLLYAISLGGDADTIASMAGAISGALYGMDDIPRSWYESCEAWQRALDHSDDMVQNVLAMLYK